LPSLFFNYLWPGVVVWSLLYVSDYALTIACARLYRAQEKIVFEGSYEITPFFQRDINSLRVVSPRFVVILVVTVTMLSVLWALTEQSTPELYEFALGSLIGIQLAVHMRHLRNLFMFRAINSTDEVHGRLEYARTLLLRMSSLECLAFSGLFLVLFIFTRSWFILGGATGCFSLAVKHRRLASNLRSSLTTGVPPPQQAPVSAHTD
jgi:hypothetical protein